MRSQESEQRYLARRELATDRVLDLTAGLGVEQRAELGVNALMVLARDMPAVLQMTLDRAQALTPGDAR